MPRGLVAQSGGGTTVINASVAGILYAAKRHGIDVYGAKHGIEGVLKRDVHPVPLTAFSDDYLQKLARTPSAELKTCRRKVTDEDIVTADNNFNAGGFDYFWHIGGNDSADTTLRLARQSRRTRVNGVPKTMDWDLYGTDFPPGAPSAGRYITIMTMNANKDNGTMPDRTPIHFIGDVLGRGAGYVPACAYLSGVEPLLVYIPEIPVSRERILDDVRTMMNKHGRVVMVASEGIRYNGNGAKPKLVSAGAIDSFGNPVLGGSAEILEHWISHDLGLKVRKAVPGADMRADSTRVSEVDRQAAWDVGVVAVQYAVNGLNGVMPMIRRLADQPYQYEIVPVPVECVVNRYRDLTEFMRDGELDVQAFKRYAAPVVGELPEYVNLDEDIHVLAAEVEGNGNGARPFESLMH